MKGYTPLWRTMRAANNKRAPTNERERDVHFAPLSVSLAELAYLLGRLCWALLKNPGNAPILHTREYTSSRG